jgi:hypothetical protein
LIPVAFLSLGAPALDATRLPLSFALLGVTLGLLAWLRTRLLGGTVRAR